MYRYGWVPSKKDVNKETAAKYNWIPNVSITHMEILRGAYWSNNPNAIFFLRSSPSLSTIPSEQKQKFFDQDDYSKLQMEVRQPTKRFSHF